MSKELNLGRMYLCGRNSEINKNVVNNDSDLMIETSNINVDENEEILNQVTRGDQMNIDKREWKAKDEIDFVFYVKFN